MKEVTVKDFYAAIGHLDAASTVIGDFPYTTEFRLRNGTLKGKVVDRIGVDDEDYIISAFYLIT